MKQSNEIYTYTYIFELKLKFILNNIRCWLFNVQNLNEEETILQQSRFFQIKLEGLFEEY